MFEFKRAGAYFSGDNATAYGNVNDEDAVGKITYNLYKLYQEGSISAKEKALISFDEEIPSKMVDDTKVYADAWLSSNKVAMRSQLRLMMLGVVLMKVVTLQ